MPKAHHWKPREGLPADARQMFLVTMTEDDFQARVIRSAEFHGWRVHKDYATNFPRIHPTCGQPIRWRRNKRGYPDLTMVHGARGLLVYVELKDQKKRLDDEQVAWLTDLALVPGLCVAIWRPLQLDAIEAFLGGSGPFPIGRPVFTREEDSA